MVAFDGGFVLAGDDGDSGLLWLSDDGTSWTEIEEPVFDGVLLGDLVVVEAGLLVVGGREDPSEAVVFSSPDGMQWQVAAGFGNSDHGTAPIAMSQSAETLVVIADIVGNDIASTWPYAHQDRSQFPPPRGGFAAWVEILGFEGQPGAENQAIRDFCRG